MNTAAVKLVLNGARASGSDGFILLTSLVLAVVFFAFTGLVIHVVMLAYHKRRAQVEADAAALGAQLRIAIGCGTACGATGREGKRVRECVAGAVVSVNAPPASGSVLGDSNYVEVTVSRVVLTTFMGSLGGTAIWR